MKYFLSIIIDFLFPKRNQEKNIDNISLKEITELPKATQKTSNIIPIFSYKNQTVKDLIWELKYHRNKSVLEKIGQYMSDFIKEDLSEKLIFNNKKNYILIPIPITNKRLAERGFCQTELLCEEIMKDIKNSEFKNFIKYEPGGLVKIKETQKQSLSKSKEERLKNLKDCFKSNTEIVYEKNIILIDDVTTTGATIHEAFKALSKCGAKEITAYTIAN